MQTVTLHSVGHHLSQQPVADGLPEAPTLAGLHFLEDSCEIIPCCQAAACLTAVASPHGGNLLSACHRSVVRHFWPMRRRIDTRLGGQVRTDLITQAKNRPAYAWQSRVRPQPAQQALQAISAGTRQQRQLTRSGNYWRRWRGRLRPTQAAAAGALRGSRPRSP